MPPRRRLTGAVLVAAALVGALSLVAPGGPASAGDSSTVLRRAAAAASSLRYEGVVRVRWSDRRGLREELIDVRGWGGGVVIGDPSKVSVTWAGGVGTTRPAPDPAAKYDLAVEPGPALLGRPTTTVRLSDGGRLREVVDLDRRTGLVLRRRVLGPDGSPVREVEVVALSEVAKADRPHGARAWHAPVLERVPPPFRAPEQLAAGYHLLGVYGRGDAVQVLYGDGVHSLSVFLQRGPADHRSLPGGGEVVMVGGEPARQWTWPGGYVLSWSERGVTTTVVGDGSLDDVVEAAGSLPALPPPSLGARLRSTCSELLELLA